MTRKINSAGLELIKSFEGCRLTAYKPISAEKYYTIGWGHYGPDVKKGQKITKKQADDMLAEDLKSYEKYVDSASYVPLTKQLNENQFSALVSFCYNCGCGSLKTLCKNRSLKEIAAALPLYVYGSGQKLPGLVRRRKAEVALYNTPVKAAVEKTKTVTASALALRSLPSCVQGKRHCYIPRGKKVTVTECDVKSADGYSWDKVTYSNGSKTLTGYCANKYLK